MSVPALNSFQVYDTTLRDGAQQEGMNLSVADKLMIGPLLDELGVGFIEGGWPGAVPKDTEFFKRAAKELDFRNAELAAFGSTRKAGTRAVDDPQVRALVDSEAPVVALVAKHDLRHAERALRTTGEENIAMIADTVAFLVREGRRVVVDAEHFFDGYRFDAAYSRAAVLAGFEAGAEVVALCDTNGGMVPAWVAQIVHEIREAVGPDAILGMHAHNDSGCAVANTLAAVEAGATHVQGCMNGYGERCGNANLASVIANLELKLGHTTIGPEKLANLTAACRFISELANLPLRNDQPFVGKSAFAHKGGIHVSAVLKDSLTYEHIRPELVGNRQRVLVSDLSGRGNILYKLKQHGLADRLTEDARRELLERIKQMESDIHQVFIDWVKSRRGSKLTAPDDKLFTGEFWSGVRGVDLGLIDALGDLHETLRARFGDKVRVRLIEPKRGLFTLPRIGLAADLAATIEDRAVWSRFGL